MQGLSLYTCRDVWVNSSLHEDEDWMVLLYHKQKQLLNISEFIKHAPIGPWPLWCLKVCGVPQQKPNRYVMPTIQMTLKQ